MSSNDSLTPIDLPLIKRLAEQLVDGIAVIDAAGRIVFANRAWATLHGYSLDELPGISIDIFHADGKAEPPILLATDSVTDIRIDRRRKDGSTFRSATRVLVLQDKSGKPEGFLIIVREVVGLTTQARSRHEQELLLDTIDGIVWEANPDTVEFSYVSRQAERILGYPIEMWLNQPDFWRDHLHPDDRAWATEFCQDAITKKENHQFEYRMVASDGHIVWLKDLVTVVVENGKVVNLRGVMVDITASKKADEILQESERKYHTLFEGIADPIFIYDRETKLFLDSNKAVERVYGYSKDELLKMTPFDLHPPEDYATLERNIDSKNIDRPNTYVHLTKSGRRIDVEILADQIDYQGRPAWIGIVRDITARKRDEQALRDSEERYRKVLENANDIVYTHDLEGNLTSINKAGERVTGYTNEEGLKMNIYDLIAPEQAEKARQMIKQKLTDMMPTSYDLELIGKDGRRISLEISSQIIHKGGQPSGVLGIARDITDRRHLEAQLRQSQKMEAVGRLAGGVAHDFNNLLTAIIGYSELLLSNPDADETTRTCVEEIRKAGERAASLTGQLLAFSRKQVLQPKVLDLNVIIANLDKMLRRLIGEDIDLDVVAEPDLWLLRADPGQVEQVIMNLAVNARDAMSGGGRLTIETSNIEFDDESIRTYADVSKGSYVALQVRDTGHGISEEVLTQIFEPFFTTKEQGKGTGLGLSTVYGIVKQSGGYIYVDSELEKGTTFTVYLPRVNEVAGVRESGAGSDDLPVGTETILLVEDEPLVRQFVSRTLRSSGYLVIEAANGNEALGIGDDYEGPIHLLVTDMVMPKMSGRELSLRFNEWRPSMKTLFISGYTDNEISSQDVVESGLSFLQKPFTPSQLASKVREVLDS